MDIGFTEIVLTVGLLLIVISGLSGLAHGTVLSVSVLAVAAGMLLHAVGVVDVDPNDHNVLILIELALVFTLFSDGLVVERELLASHIGPTARALVLAMPATMAMIAVAAKMLFGALTWPEALLLGAVLAPTDPVITSAVVTAKAIPAKLRHVLNLESGLNDGLALPFVLFFIVIASHEAGAGTEAAILIGEAAAGALIGLGLATLAGRAIDDMPGIGLTRKYEGVYALGVALAAFGLAEATIGNGLVATFVAGIALGVADRDTPEAFLEFNESLGAVLQTVTFFVFGALVASIGIPSPAIAVAVLLLFTLFIARPVAISASLAGSDMPTVQRRFLAWFGPKGVASMLFALLVLESDAPGSKLIFQLAALVILGSIIAHGLTDTVGARWIERQLGTADGAGSPEEPAAPRGSPPTG
ncbi:MAG: cation:proton antiporter [Thermoleophilia bacterium]|nr:cation:proton antiporter [Thermoleophilia bacterium]